MGGTGGDVVGSTGRWKLWHLSALVLGSALILAAIRDEASRLLIAPIVLVFTPVFLIVGLALLGRLVRLGVGLGRTITHPLWSWSIRRGGVLGFVAWLVAGVALGAIALAVVGGVVFALAAVVYQLFLRITGGA